MALVRYLAAHLAAAGLIVTGAVLASPFSNAVHDADIATDFVSELTQNITAFHQEHQQLPLHKHALVCSQSSSLTVDVGYAKYQGRQNSATGVNVWKGIRYATAARWQPPRLPPPHPNAPITQATKQSAQCPNSSPSVGGSSQIEDDEDCLFLNVYAPAKAQNLPALVWIHGGGYGLGNNVQDMTEIINANNQGFLVVSIQYRLGAFGFLASQEVKNKGVVNAGLLDQAFALAWVKLFICKFGGNPLAVTIAGESAGAGSVMYHNLAVNGTLGPLLFDKSIVNSPYLPFQYNYNDAIPTSRYYAFAQAAGCPSSGDVFACLQSKDSATLQQANYVVTNQAPHGYWAFYPVTDHAYIMSLASQQLADKQVNGMKLLVGFNANEGPLFVPNNIDTESQLAEWLKVEFPKLSATQINSILTANPNSNPTNRAGPFFETNGLSGANALNMSGGANGQQQRGYNIYAEATFVCPAYWFASAFTGSSAKKAYTYQYSVPFARHGTDIAGYFGPQTENQSNDFVLAFRRIWGNFIITGNPSITSLLANGQSTGTTSAHPVAAWPAWTESAPKLVNLNETGGVQYQAPTQWGFNVTQFKDPGLENAIAIVDANSWEGGRGQRCAFWKQLAPSIPA
ncbi:hypothetical protein GE21DRAFT_5167 [Neurospora crassa]|uniref:Carboxylic ester hydrolase n=1 Tax=Neurospora crassa (strain ATCC 24698 / 74-OR23-1A / CBS 708.71 / DSM 1257 / FGSC 987) TaxID=367110 RepID=Q7RWP5_NEUCR|nr:acetylcholinesterase [Neurospora crassa OR74A]EAA26865.2 acetylcholinesterase [Neurospora crassa OR74A]KHE83052.1 hypothetical protein GE21DRAFT_5167 [Neurospora crassa]|eukprot:XP_956101.2 acetylcholinesterase [Neurospora crassa OR74A]